MHFYNHVSNLTSNMPSDRFPGEWEPVNLWISEEEKTVIIVANLYQYIAIKNILYCDASRFVLGRLLIYKSAYY